MGQRWPADPCSQTVLRTLLLQGLSHPTRDGGLVRRGPVGGVRVTARPDGLGAKGSETRPGQAGPPPPRLGASAAGAPGLGRPAGPHRAPRAPSDRQRAAPELQRKKEAAHPQESGRDGGSPRPLPGADGGGVARGQNPGRAAEDRLAGAHPVGGGRELCELYPAGLRLSASVQEAARTAPASVATQRGHSALAQNTASALNPLNRLITCS